MKAKIIEIINDGMEPERAECKANDIIELFVEKLRKAYFDGLQAGYSGRYSTFDEDNYLS